MLFEFSKLDMMPWRSARFVCCSTSTSPVNVASQNYWNTRQSLHCCQIKLLHPFWVIHHSFGQLVSWDVILLQLSRVGLDGLLLPFANLISKIILLFTFVEMTFQIEITKQKYKYNIKPTTISTTLPKQDESNHCNRGKKSRTKCEKIWKLSKPTFTLRLLSTVCWVCHLELEFSFHALLAS